MTRLVKTIKQSIVEFIDDGCISSAAAIAYYAIFALPPIFMIVFVSVSYLGASQKSINESIEKGLGVPTRVAANSSSASDANENDHSSAKISLGGIAKRTESKRKSQIGTISGIVGLIVLIFTATGMFSQLQLALNRAWGVEPDKSRSPVRRFFVKRLLSLGLILLMALLLLASVVLTTAINMVYSNAQRALPGTVSHALRFILDNIATLVVGTSLFAVVFKFLPDADMCWRDVWIGAGATAVLFIAGKELISLYLQNVDLGASWGEATTSIIAVLAWVYYTSLILLFGAELTQAWARYFGEGFRPQEGAVEAGKRNANPT